MAGKVTLRQNGDEIKCQEKMREGRRAAGGLWVNNFLCLGKYGGNALRNIRYGWKECTYEAVWLRLCEYRVKYGPGCVSTE